jgi:hypothetical protein
VKQAPATHWVEDVEELRAGGQAEVFPEVVDAAHGEAHGDGGAEREEVGGREVELRVRHVRQPCAVAARYKAHRGVGDGAQERVTESGRGKVCHSFI